MLNHFNHVPLFATCQALTVHGILQARIVDWDAIPFSRGRQGSYSHLLHLLCLLYWQAASLSLMPPWSEVKWSESLLVVSNSLQSHGLYSQCNSPGQNTGVGSLSLRQGIFPTQGSNPGLPHCRWILYQLSHKGSRGILEW